MIKRMINKRVMVKRKNIVIYKMLGIGMMPSYVEFLEIDYVPFRNYPLLWTRGI